MTRWLIIIQEFDIDISHIAGEDNVFANTLSRLLRLDDVDPYNFMNWIPSVIFFYSLDKYPIPEDNKYF